MSRFKLIDDVISIINHTLLNTIKAVIGTFIGKSTASNSMSDSECYYWLYTITSNSMFSVAALKD